MLEASIIIEFVLGKTADALITLALLLVNAVLSFVQATRTQNALALLRQQLAVQARVQRNGTWRQIPAQELVPGDVVHLRMGDIAPADVRVAAGQLAADQSALTGESAAVDVGVNATVYAGSIVRRGEATGEVTATGSRTFYGKTAQLVGTAKTASHLESVVQGVTAYLAAVSVAMLLLVVIYGSHRTQAAIGRPAAFCADPVGGISARRTARYLHARRHAGGRRTCETQCARGQALRRGGSSGHGCTLQR